MRKACGVTCFFCLIFSLVPFFNANCGLMVCIRTFVNNKKLQTKGFLFDIINLWVITLHDRKEWSHD